MVEGAALQHPERFEAVVAIVSGHEAEVESPRIGGAFILGIMGLFLEHRQQQTQYQRPAQPLQRRNVAEQ